MNITTRTTIVSNVQLDDNIRVWLLEEEGFKSTPETWKCRRRNISHYINEQHTITYKVPFDSIKLFYIIIRHFSGQWI